MIKTASLNCRGLSKKLKRRTVFRTCLQYDIICLQETYITKEKYNEWKLDWKGQLEYLEGTNRSKGLIILLNEKYENVRLLI